jgi:hypothetical protein
METEGPPAVWGEKGARAIVESCPNCGYAYADGGYCPPAEGGCGWAHCDGLSASHYATRFADTNFSFAGHSVALRGAGRMLDD